MIAVVGSLNLDLVAPVPRHPVPGETVLGGDIAEHPGGKGANQAVAAARLGGEVAMVGRVGDDDAAQLMLEAVRGQGVDSTHVVRTEGVPTGRAMIAVGPTGENSIVVSPGANARLSAADCEGSADLLGRARVTVLQQEVPDEANHAAARLSGGIVVHNPAPAGENTVPPPYVDLLVPNRTELAALAGTPVPKTIDQVVAAARRMTGAGAVVVTLGGDGVLLLEGGASLHIPAFTVRATDTTAAGDCFCGALAVGLAEGRTLEQAARWAAAAAALSTTRPGAQPSLARRDEVEAFLAERG
ncbi:ribokinase [Streptomyces tsukubensis]|uniref:Ribokinase n=1 Tax=Streptomyces tsukubensis TaxID=83656 RepID=A0A1V4A6D8_9ACTN|nr:ribokinase [Streptomyces tsukubensis]OON76638.1 ribokinase [Streptomyces tsukubensis]QFR93397.1 ribokinase [Streptomyces tsukubensis]